MRDVIHKRSLALFVRRTTERVARIEPTNRRVPEQRVTAPVGGASRTLPAAAARSDRASRFLARLDTHLPIISDRPARCAFLDRQLEGWERRYARFLATEGRRPIPPIRRRLRTFCSPIVGLAARRSALARDER